MNFGQNEIWRAIDGYLNYEVSTHGRVRNNKTGKIIKQSYSSGYLIISLYEKRKSSKYVHRLVCDAFSENPNKYNVVDHIDRNKANNYYENLRWVNHSENSRNQNKPKNNKSGHIGIIKIRDNTWRASWTDNNKKVKTKTFYTMEEAIAYRKEMEKLYNYLTIDTVSNSNTVSHILSNNLLVIES
jgi:hypothetical protein